MNNSDDEDFSDEEFYTPPQSPVLEFFDDSSPKILFDNFIFGYVHNMFELNWIISPNHFSSDYSQEPTKMDNDVLNALHNIEIDKNSFPNVYIWHKALMKFSLEERARYV